MASGARILVVNPGSTSTKVAVFEDARQRWIATLDHPAEQLRNFRRVIDQCEFRQADVVRAVEAAGFSLRALAAVVGRGGLLHPLVGGTYRVDERLLADLRAEVQGEHASNLGGLIAGQLAQRADCPAFIVDPVVVDELAPLARYSGLPPIRRRSIFHALNQRAAARKVAERVGKRYEQGNFIVAHLGGGISVGAHRRGRVIDVNNALDGDGPFAPERSGGLPAGDLARLCFSGQHTPADVQHMIRGGGGVVGYLGTNDMRAVEGRIGLGDRDALEVYEAMAYQVAKEIAALAAVLCGEVDAVVLTGGLARSEMFVGWIKQRIGFLGPVHVFAGEMEMEALALGALRVLRGEERPRAYLGQTEAT